MDQIWQRFPYSWLIVGGLLSIRPKLRLAIFAS